LVRSSDGLLKITSVGLDSTILGDPGRLLHVVGDDHDYSDQSVVTAEQHPDETPIR
jgi:hypothetical protein